MREMIYAEWIGIRMSVLQMAVRVIAVALFGMMLAGPIMLCMVVVMPAVLVPRMLCDAAASADWEAYSLTLPTGRRNIVASRYALVLCCNGVAAVISLTSIVGYRVLSDAAEQIPYDLVAILISVAGAMTVSGLMLAVSGRWGLNRANYLIVGGMGILYLMIAVIRRTEVLYNKWQFFQNYLMIWLADSNIIVAASLLMMAGCVIFVFCYVLSVRTYQKKEL